MQRGRQSLQLTSLADKLVLTAEANCELHYPGIGCGAGDASEGGGSEASIGLSEGGRVGYVEQLGAKFHARFAEQCGVLYERQVKVPIGRTTDRVSGSRPDSELGSSGKGAGVEEARRRTTIG